jgi:hypothetical protein
MSLRGFCIIEILTVHKEVKMAIPKAPADLHTTKSHTRRTKRLKSIRVDLGLFLLVGLGLAFLPILDKTIIQTDKFNIGMLALTALLALLLSSHILELFYTDRTLLAFGDSEAGKVLLAQGDIAMRLQHQAESASEACRTFANSNPSNGSGEERSALQLLRDSADKLHREAGARRRQVVSDQCTSLAGQYENAGERIPWADPAAA